MFQSDYSLLTLVPLSRFGCYLPWALIHIIQFDMFTVLSRADRINIVSRFTGSVS